MRVGISSVLGYSSVSRARPDEGGGKVMPWFTDNVGFLQCVNSYNFFSAFTMCFVAVVSRGFDRSWLCPGRRRLEVEYSQRA